MALHERGITTSTEERALELLGSGLGAQVVADSLGVDISRISQLLSREDFATKVAERRFIALQKHTARDLRYDNLEDKLIEKLENIIGLMYKPSDIIRALVVVNTAKRRGASAPEQIVNQQNIVNLVLPSVTVNQFTADVNNVVIKAGDQDLVTIQSGSLLNKVRNKSNNNERVISSTEIEAQDDGANLSERLAHLRQNIATANSGT